MKETYYIVANLLINSYSSNKNDFVFNRDISKYTGKNYKGWVESLKTEFDNFVDSFNNKLGLSQIVVGKDALLEFRKLDLMGEFKRLNELPGIESPNDWDLFDYYGEIPVILYRQLQPEEGFVIFKDDRTIQKFIIKRKSYNEVF